MSLKEVAEVAEIVGGGAAVIALVWAFVKYGLERIVGVQVRGKSEWRSVDGIRVEITNLSRKRSVQVRDVEVLHSRGLLRRREPEAAGPGLQPHTPWEIVPDRTRDGWMPLTAVDGSRLGPGPARWDFARPVRLRARLATGPRPTSRRFRVH
jgi:hypothetical protein